ncbi:MULTISPECIES: glycine zipper 2TM domain-containing protein [Haloterrigena]|uniref:17 kDa surface antigen n=2 Tax=Haloterrigena TaxID=121871 RepID=M0BQS3_9EURY|nr:MULTISPECIES: glycine zipper 2TM domain-containing protein [Haloterrigena]ELZ12753.1 17 kDa surface antigen [Haloterrigena salina JCM 13891]QRV15421.1 glycine zipper 2TM domain-containing protein [Haloterrigena salifodinae]
MKERIKRVLLRARYAAIGAAVGAAIGSVFSRNAASTGGAIGAMTGATIADTRETATAVLEEAREQDFVPLSEDADSDSN